MADVRTKPTAPILTERQAEDFAYKRTLYESNPALRPDGLMPSIRRARSHDRTKSYSVIGSGIDDYERSFAPVLSGRAIADVCRGTKGLVVLDLMSSTAAIESLFSELRDVEKLGIAVCYSESPYIGRFPNNTIVEIGGDLRSITTRNDVMAELNGRKATLILERAVAGLSNLPRHGVFFAGIINYAWRLLEPDGGTILAETPTLSELIRSGVSHNRFNEWIKLLRRHGIDAEAAYSEYSSKLFSAFMFPKLVIRITRKPSDPESLPFLDRAILRQAEPSESTQEQVQTSPV